MKKILLGISLFSAVTSFSQPTWLWAQGGGGTLYETAASIAVDANDFVYSAGGFESAGATFGSQTLTNAMADTLDAYVVQYDVNGNMMWARQAGGVRTDEITSMCAHISGGVVVAGYFYSPTITFGTFTLTNTSGYSDGFLVHYDAAGTVTWATKLGGIYDDQPRAIEIDQSGNICMTGFFLADSLILGTDTLLCVGTYDVFVAKFDSNGNPLWARSEGTSGDDRGSAITTDQSGNVIIGGVFHSGPFAYGTYTLTYEGGAYSDIFLAKYDALGNLVWARDEGGTYLDEPQSLATDMFDNIYMAAIVYSDTIVIGSDVLINSGIVAYCDIVLAKYNPSGTPQWARKYGVGTGNDIVMSVAVESGLHPYITGIAGTGTAFGIYIHPGIGCFVTRFDSAGTVQWSDYTQNAYGTDILIRNNGDIVLGGMVFNASATFGGSFPIVNSGIYDVFVAYASQTIAIEENNENSNVVVYPNPVNNQLSFQGIPENTPYSLTITNAIGEIVAQKYISAGEKSFDVSALAPGIYFTALQGEHFNSGLRFVIAR
jgi:hypothetical protein